MFAYRTVCMQIEKCVKICVVPVVYLCPQLHKSELFVFFQIRMVPYPSLMPMNLFKRPVHRSSHELLDMLTVIEPLELRFVLMAVKLWN